MFYDFQKEEDARVNQERDRVYREVCAPIYESHNCLVPRLYSSYLFSYQNSESSSLVPSCYYWQRYTFILTIITSDDFTAQVGYRILAVQPDGPASRGKLEATVDIIVAVRGHRLRVLDSTLIEAIKVDNTLRYATSHFYCIAHSL